MVESSLCWTANTIGLIAFALVGVVTSAPLYSFTADAVRSVREGGPASTTRFAGPESVSVESAVSTGVTESLADLRKWLRVNVLQVSPPVLGSDSSARSTQRYRRTGRAGEGNSCRSAYRYRRSTLMSRGDRWTDSVIPVVVVHLFVAGFGSTGTFTSAPRHPRRESSNDGFSVYHPVSSASTAEACE